MSDGTKTKKQLLLELALYRERVEQLEKAEIKPSLMQDILRQSEERYKTILENIEDGYHEVDLQGKFTFFNESCRKIMGYDKAELLGMHYKQYSDPLNAQKVSEAYKQVYKTGHPLKRFIWEIIRKDGARRQIAVSVSLIRSPSGEPTGFRGIVRDETDRQEAEEALRSNEKKYRDIFDNAQEGIYRASLEGKFLSVNLSLAKMMGYDSPEEMIRSISDIGKESYANPQERTKLLDLLQAEDEVEDFEFEAYRKDKSTFWISTNIRLVRGADGRVLYIQGMCIDITKRKEAEEALKRERTKFQIVVEKSPWGIALINKEGVYQFINRNYTEILGYTLEDFSTGRQWFQKAFPDPHYRRQVIADWFNDLKEIGTGESRPRTFRVCCKNGQEKWIHFRPVSLEDGSQLVAYEDVSERKRTEDALRLSEERYRTIFEQSNDGIALMKGEIHLHVNQKMAQIFGYNQPEELIGRPITLTVHPDDQERVQEINRRRQIGEPVPQKYEMKGRRKDGRTIFVEISATKTDYRGEVVALVFMRDITERKLAEEALRESEAQYRALIETTNTGFVILDMEGRVLDANEEYIRLTGHLDFQEIKNRSVVDWTAEYEKKKNSEAVRQCLREGKIRNLEIDYQDLSGKNTSVEINATVVEQKGEPRILSVCRDITERKRAEEARRNLEERLQRAEKMEALGTLAGGVAHDLNNVLGVLVGYSELLMLEAPDGSPLGDHALDIFKAGQRATAIIQDLLTLARRGVAISEVLNLNRIIRDFLHTPEFESLKLHHPQVSFRMDLAPELLNIKGSPVHLIKTVMNLLSNGAEAVSGPGEVVIRTENHYIDKQIPGYEETRMGEYVLLTVSDTGDGISETDMGRIFEPFYTKKVMGRSGTGLGLAVVWGTVKDHNGYIDVRSEKGKGSTFTLYFPISRENLLEELEPPSRSEYQGRGESILVVDDVKEQRTLAATMLSNLGYEVKTISNGEEAIEFLQNHPVNLLVLDMIMEPGIDGLETYERILKFRPRQKAIIVSGFSETERVRKALNLGAGEYVRKPYVLEKIGMAVRRELDK